MNKKYHFITEKNSFIRKLFRALCVFVGNHKMLVKTRLLLFTFCLPSCIFAQDDDEATFSASKMKEIEANMQLVWNDPDADFKISVVPDKWKNESGVIIAQKTKFSFDKDANKLAVYEITRRRIKLNDRDAVNSYSAFYFRIGSSRDGAGFKIIKPDGTIRDVSIRSALLVEDLDDVPSTFAPYIGKADTKYDKSKSRVIFYKLAIPDLAPGDVIDYGTIFYDDNTVKKMNYIEFDPIYFICTREYPILSQKFEIDTDNNSFVNSKSINGAPEFKETGNATAEYTWEDRSRERLTDNRWVNMYVDLPLVKFQIVFSRQENRGDLFIGDRGELKRSLTPDELAKKINTLYKQLDNDAGSYLSTIQYYLKQVGYENLREDDFINRLYYIIRHVAHFRMEGGMSSELFAYCFMKKLDLRKIPYEFIVSAQSDVTKPGDIIFRSEPEWYVKVKDKYVFNPTPYSNPFDFRDDFQGNTAYVITLGKNAAASSFTMPFSNADENVVSAVVTAGLDTATQHLKTSIVKTISGMSKGAYNGEVFNYTTFFLDDYKTYGGEDDVRSSLNGTQLADFETKLREKKKEDKVKKLEYMKKVLGDDFDNVVSYEEFVLNTDGRTAKKPDLGFTHKAILGDMVKKAGSNLLVSVPGLIENQLFIGQDERTREYDADLSFPRTLKWEITFTIPDGYKVIGADNLNVLLDNEVGYFKAASKVEGNQLLIAVKKQYKKVSVKKEEWTKLLQFADAAFNFSQKKILLKKL